MHSKRLATREDWLLRCQLQNDPNTMVEDPFGKPAEPWQQEQAKKLCELEDNLEWRPTLVRDSNGLWGIWNQFEDKQMLPCEYDEFGPLPELTPLELYFDGPIPAQKSGKWGLVASNGTNQVLLPFEYDSIQDKGYGFLLRRNNLYGLYYNLIEDSSKAVFPCIADEIWHDEPLFMELYRRNGKIGLVQPYTDAIFDKIAVGKKINKDGNYLILFELDGQNGYLTLDGTFVPDGLEELSGMKLLDCWYIENL